MLDLQTFSLPACGGTWRQAMLILALAALAAGCEGREGRSAEATADCVENGSLSASLYGGIRSELDWRAEALQCDGMPRPHGRGARLHFAGPATTDGETLALAFIITLPDLLEGKSPDETPASVTLIDETAGRFFSTPDSPACWAEVEQQKPLDDLPNPDYLVEGLLYCVSPLAEVRGSASVTLGDLRFAGRLSWLAPE